MRIFKRPLLICTRNAAQLVLDSKIYLPVNSRQVRIIFGAETIQASDCVMIQRPVYKNKSVRQTMQVIQIKNQILSQGKIRTETDVVFLQNCPPENLVPGDSQQFILIE